MGKENKDIRRTLSCEIPEANETALVVSFEPIFLIKRFPRKVLLDIGGMVVGKCQNKVPEI